jgi:hypothetical protein
MLTGATLSVNQRVYTIILLRSNSCAIRSHGLLAVLVHVAACVVHWHISGSGNAVTAATAVLLLAQVSSEIAYQHGSAGDVLILEICKMRYCNMRLITAACLLSTSASCIATVTAAIGATLRWTSTTCY